MRLGIILVMGLLLVACGKKPDNKKVDWASYPNAERYIYGDEADKDAKHKRKRKPFYYKRSRK